MAWGLGFKVGVYPLPGSRESPKIAHQRLASLFSGCIWASMFCVRGYGFPKIINPKTKTLHSLNPKPSLGRRRVPVLGAYRRWRISWESKIWKLLGYRLSRLMWESLHGAISDNPKP